MRDIFIKFKIIDFLELKLDITKRDFLEKMKTLIQPGKISPFAGLSEIFTKDKRPYIGAVENSGFLMRRRRDLFSKANVNVAATGEVSERNGKLLVKIEVNGLYSTFKTIVWTLIVFYLLAMVGIIIVAFKGNMTASLIGFIAIVVHAIFMAVVLYFTGKNSTKRLKKELHHELSSISSKVQEDVWNK